MTIIDGKKLSEKYYQKIKLFLEKNSKNKQPGLAMILVGDNPASQIYVNRKQSVCNTLGIHSIIKHFPRDTLFEKIASAIETLNNDTNINGILMQLPTPDHINSFKLLERINPIKDVDGLHPLNLGYLFWQKAELIPCTPLGCLQLIKSICPNLSGKKAVILGRSVLVGHTTAVLLTHNNTTVELVHSRSKNVEKICRSADIIVSAIGQPKKIIKDYIKEGTIIIDVGINKVGDKIVGDVDFENVSEKTCYITPVPGGVGPMTVCNLMMNTLKAYCHQQSDNGALTQQLKAILQE